MNILERFASVTTFAFDMDGVLTDGSVWVFPGNELIRRMDIKDGYALQLAVKKGYRVAVITGSHSLPMEERLATLGITDFFQRVQHKKEQLDTYITQHKLSTNEVLYMGDDIPDYEVMQAAGIACCPADAVTEIKTIAHYISPRSGGKGCVRDVIEKVLKINGQWETDTEVRNV
ncbi:HAD hydrolase-like protein [Agriterribacter sp.]|uniref:KdsC family phosphatase n=1 Tax=Agriterribacter sp. TaxID=2821509 RepID=UPI002BA32150|nr:HAD hydrolase-like protein [Agriterribacter sp.]HRO45541.1 HAD hydrolase-like protein [Agriterribacter sp.]HRQ17937.1 HAD hydrolase-like protein [Agriterribacter sp.]